MKGWNKVNEQDMVLSWCSAVHSVCQHKQLSQFLRSWCYQTQFHSLSWKYISEWTGLIWACLINAKIFSWENPLLHHHYHFCNGHKTKLGATLESVKFGSMKHKGWHSGWAAVSTTVLISLSGISGSFVLLVSLLCFYLLNPLVNEESVDYFCCSVECTT